jgi:hypothetical protein
VQIALELYGAVPIYYFYAFIRKLAACYGSSAHSFCKLIRLFAHDCIIYRKILSIEDVEKLQTNLGRLGDWVEGN